jgi:AraC-like DNA-binding protein
MTGSTVTSKGQLLADPDISVERRMPSPGLATLVRHYWIPRWGIPAGVVAQHVLEYPAMNLVVEPDEAAIYRVSRGCTERVLSGTGWAFGVLLQPGTGRAILGRSARGSAPKAPLGDLTVPGTARLAAEIRDASSDDDAMVDVFERWLSGIALDRGPDAALIDAIVRAVEDDRSIIRVDDLADRFGLSVRRLQRLVGDFIGFSPKWLIQRYRLQEAAHALEDAAPPALADLAAALGYADQAHFSREFKAVIGSAPGAYTTRAAQVAQAAMPAMPAPRVALAGSEDAPLPQSRR